MRDRRRRVLLSVYACAPGRGSEAGVGWNAVLAASRDNDVWALTDATWRSAIETAGAQSEARVRWIFVSLPLPRSARWRSTLWLHYYLWQLWSFRAARRLHREVGFDLAHHVTYASWRVPSLLFRLGIPFAFGPIGGGQRSPSRLRRVLSPAARIVEAGRDVLQRVSRRDPLVRAALRRASAVLAANSATADFLAPLCARPPCLMSEARVEADPPASSGGGDTDTLELLWVGVFEPRKALPLALRAISCLGDMRVRLTVVGDGPERSRWQTEAAWVGVGERVRFLGQIARAQMWERYRQSDILVFTSLRDTTPWVVLEAMACEVPVVAVDCDGARDLLQGGVGGILVTAADVDETARGIAEAIRALAADPSARRAAGARGRARVVERYTWDAYRGELARLYDALDPAAPEPA